MTSGKGCTLQATAVQLALLRPLLPSHTSHEGERAACFPGLLLLSGISVASSPSLPLLLALALRTLSLFPPLVLRTPFSGDSPDHSVAYSARRGGCFEREVTDSGCSSQLSRARSIAQCALRCATNQTLSHSSESDSISREGGALLSDRGARVREQERDRDRNLRAPAEFIPARSLSSPGALLGLALSCSVYIRSLRILLKITTSRKGRREATTIYRPRRNPRSGRSGRSPRRTRALPGSPLGRPPAQSPRAKAPPKSSKSA